MEPGRVLPLKDRKAYFHTVSIAKDTTQGVYPSRKTAETRAGVTEAQNYNQARNGVKRVSNPRIRVTVAT